MRDSLSPSYNESLAYAYYNRATHYLEKGLYTKSESDILKALSIVRKQFGGKIRPVHAKWYRALILIAIKVEDYQKGLEYAQQALINSALGFEDENVLTNPDLSAKSNLPMFYTRILGQKAFLLQKLSEQDEKYQAACIDTWQLAIANIDKYAQNYQNQKDRLFFQQEVRQIYAGYTQSLHSLYRKTGDVSYLQTAFQLSEKSQAVLLREGLQSLEALNLIPPDKQSRENELRNKIITLNRQIAVQEEDVTTSAIDESLSSKLFEIQRQYQAFIDSLKLTHPKYFELRYDNTIPSVADIQRSLQPGEAYIKYFLGDMDFAHDSTLYIYCITPEGFHAYQQPIREQFLKMMDSLYQLVSAESAKSYEIKAETHPVFEGFVWAAHGLYENMLAPLSVQLKDTQKLIIAPDGPVWKIPFDCLLTQFPPSPLDYDFSNLPYLLKHYQVRYHYSANLMVVQRENKAAKNTPYDRMAFFPEYHASMYVKQGNALIRYNNFNYQSLNLEDWEVRRGKQAQKAAFMQEAGLARLLFLPVHGQMLEDRPNHSGFVMSMTGQVNDTLLYAEIAIAVYELYSMQIGADLVVTPACNSANGKIFSGEGIMSLGRALSYAGCPNLVTSLWNTDFQTMAQQMSRYLELLEAGMPKAEVLRQVKLESISENGGHPYFWANMVLTGDDEPIEFEDKNWAGFWIFIVVLLIGCSWLVGQKFSMKKEEVEYYV